MYSEPILVAREVTKRFGGLRALDHVDLTVGKGEIVGLIGPNGSGKTTFINSVSGIAKVDGGGIEVLGTDVTRKPPHRRVHLGVNRTYQIPAPFHRLTVRENMDVAAAYGGGTADPRECIERVGLAGSQHREAGALNSTEQKLLDLARALVTSPRLLLVDEIAAGLNPDEARRLSALLGELADSGISLLVVEHLIPFVRTLATRVVVMDRGAVIFEGNIDDAFADQRVAEVFLGRDASDDSE